MPEMGREPLLHARAEVGAGHREKSRTGELIALRGGEGEGVEKTKHK